MKEMTSLLNASVHRGQQKRVKDPMKEAYAELDKAFPILFVQTLSSKLFLFHLPRPESLPGCHVYDSLPEIISDETLSKLIDVSDGDGLLARDQEPADDKSCAAARSPDRYGRRGRGIEEATVTALSYLDSDGSDEDEEADCATEAAAKGLPDSDVDDDSDGSDVDEEADCATEAALQRPSRQ